MLERGILARGGRVFNWTADGVLEGKRGEMYNCKSQSLLPLEIPLVSSGSVGNRVREKEINLRRAAPRNGYYPGFTAPAETPIRYGRVTTRLSRGSYGFT